MKFLNHLNLVENELRFAKMYRISSATYTPSINTSGNIILDTATGQGIPKWWDQTGNSGSGAWRDFAYGTASISNWNIQSDNGANIQVDTGETLDLTGGEALATTTGGTATAPVVTFDVQNYGVMNATTTAATAGDATTKIYGVERHPTTDKLQVHVPWTQHKQTTFTVAGDSGGGELISDSDTLTLAGGTGMTTVDSSTDTVTFNANTWGINSSASAAQDSTETGNRWYGVHTDSNDKLVVRVPWTDTTYGSWTLRDDDNDSFSISNGKFVKIVAATGALGTNVTGSGTTGSPYLMTITSPDTTYSEMTDSVFGLGKHAYNTVGTISYANAYAGGDGFTSNRTYGVIGDSDGKLCVHVPWDAGDTNTDVDVDNAHLLTRLANLESAGGNLDQDIVIGTDAGDTIVITGNLKVSGTTTTINTATLDVEDNIVRINKLDSGASSANTLNSGIEVERGSLANVQILWTESNDTWYLQEATDQLNGGTLVSKKIIQNVFTSVTGDAGSTCSATTPSTTVAITGSSGISTTTGAGTVDISGASVMAQFSKVATITATGINASTNKKATIAHSLSTKDVVVRLYEMNGEGQYDEIYANVAATTTANVTVQFSANLSNNVRAVIMAASSASAVSPSYS